MGRSLVYSTFEHGLLQKVPKVTKKNQNCDSGNLTTNPLRLSLTTIWQLSRLLGLGSSTHSSISFSMPSGLGSLSAQAAST